MIRKIFTYILLSSLLIILPSSSTWKRMDYTAGINKNVCKSLNGEVLVYLIFVDSKQTTPWTQFDIQTTLDSTITAIRWLENQAEQNGVNLKMKSDCHVGNEYTTVKKNLPQATVGESSVEPNMEQGLQALNKWADGIARLAGASFQMENQPGIPEIKNPKNKERLVAYLRDHYKVESVVLLYMVNNYYKTDVSIPVNHLDTEDVEFSIVSYKYSSEIAHNILHLFGAADLFETAYRKDSKNLKYALANFPNDIMQNTYGKPVNDFNIGEFTQYLIGWNKELAVEHEDLLTDKLMNF